MKPNFIFIVADDLGAHDLGCCGGGDDASPNLDRLAREGMLFSRAYSNSSVCSPARFALITGRWQYRLRGGVEEPLGRRSDVLGLPPSHPTLPSLLLASGYETALMGKWHLGLPPLYGPLRSGYEEFFGPLGGAVDYFSYRNFSGDRDLWEDEHASDAHGYLTDLISERAAAFVTRERGDVPFFLSVHYTSPHWPWETREDAEESNRIGAAIAHLDGGSVATYRKMVQQMDEGIGRVVAALSARQRENTMIVFMSDNGGERFSNNWPFIGGKMDLLEGGIRVPQIAWWPGRIAAGSATDLPTLTMDWMPTMLAASKVTSDPAFPLDGIDLSPVFRDTHWRPERSLFWRMKHRRQAASLHERWKYLRVDGHEYLFDVVADARERANQGKRFPEQLAEMRESWNAWARTMPGIPDDADVYLLWDERDMPRPTH